VYENPLAGRVEISNGDEGLTLTFESGVTAVLHHTQDHRFKATTEELYLPSFYLVFQTQQTGPATVLELALQPGTDSLVFQRAEGGERPPGPPAP
jgi:hypothetical protein